MRIKNFLNWSDQKNITRDIFRILHEGCEMINPSEGINEGSLDKAEYELDRLEKNKKGDLIISEFIPEIKSLIKKFSESGQSGGSAPFTISVILDTIKKLLNQEPLGGIENTEDEWNSLDIFGDIDSYQNKRLSSVFKEGIKGRPYYLNSIVFRNPEKNYTFTSNSVSIKGKGEKIRSSNYIKNFPFEPKTFVIDVEEKEYRKEKDGRLVPEEGGGWWESWIKDPKQLEEVWKYYDRKN